MIKSYKDLIVWQKSVSLVEEIYKLTNSFPREEQFGLIAQLRRASVSIPSNIAEGYGRKSSKEYAQFCTMAYGSALEVETQLYIAKRLKLTSEKHFETCEEILVEVLKMLNSLRFKLASKSS